LRSVLSGAMTIDSLEGGELEAEIARHLFGHTVEARTSRTTARRRFVYRMQPQRAEPHWVPVPLYAASQAATIEVLLWLHGFAMHVENGDERCRVVLTRDGAGEIIAEGAHR